MIVKLLTVTFVIGCVFGAPKDAKVELCTADICKAPACRCSSTDIPGGLEAKDIPQIVFLTFDDAVTADLGTDYYNFFLDKTNPDGCPISPTYFASHEYTNYSVLHNLHAVGHEIALHSITHDYSTEYWKKLNVEGYVNEFEEQMEIISHFAKIPKEDLRGLRVPQLQGSGDVSFDMMEEVGLMYDCTWPSQLMTNPGLWPYTLDYASTQDCPIGPCPVESHPGIWVVPMLTWKDESGANCAMTDACVNVPKNKDDLTQYMISQFERSYNGNRAPFGFFLHAAWFRNGDHPYRWPAYQAFVEYINNIPDVYMVGISRGLEWVKNPKTTETLSEVWPECQKTSTPNCAVNHCYVEKESDNSYRYFAHCQEECPSFYPWLGNPLGQRPSV